ncbi:MAG: tRNA (adenosine(37)-N6)-threonylcarbamoyltransferase complex dimerization subunit type 1 TsaB [Flavobacteriales bacterium]|jgi:tRNA threonylcarbamoyladenosine biosynthesis protein TsaB|nr:tRNA (adenosine(37)-N6)-threonylcarbamoyltransferase complex dimerization subunit type 1 TsaB [Flavobacteriales bacterium]
MSIYILNIETSTKACSVAIHNDGKLLNCKESVTEEFSHSEKLLLFISDVMNESRISFSQLNAVAVSMGPGSYTGLRIGVSTAKGLCYALDIPLISVSTLQAMAYGMLSVSKADLFCPMIDARRMEVYSAFFDSDNIMVREVQADIVDGSSYDVELRKKVIFFGDGSDKLKDVIKHKNAIFQSDFYPSAEFIGVLSYNKFVESNFEDVAYFEPYYLKDFVAGKKS